MEINWQQFGLRRNPYDTNPLLEGSELSIDEAFVGRDMERRFLDDIILSEARSCVVVEGDVGVGKTSLVNFHKFTWKKNRKSKQLFSFRREIEISLALLNKKSFLLELLGSVIREITLLDPVLVLDNEELQRVVRLLDVSQDVSLSGGFTVAGFGGQAGRGVVTSHPLVIPITTLEQYLIGLLKFICSSSIADNRYSGLIVHVNNFDFVLADAEVRHQVSTFFHEIRDLLQTADIHWVFIGPYRFFADHIAHSRRVKSIFYSSPLVVKPLSKREVTDAFNRRLEILQSKDVKNIVKPFEDEVIHRLYDVFNGDVRLIMTALRDILGQYTDRVTQTLSVEEAIVLLSRDRQEKVMQIKLTDEQYKILEYIIALSEPVSQKTISSVFRKKQSNVTSYYFKPLHDAGIIEVVEQRGRIKLWDLTEIYWPLREAKKAELTIVNRAEREVAQLQLL